MSKKQFSNHNQLRMQLQYDQFLSLIESGRLKSEKDMCKNGICPVVIQEVCRSKS